jgi:hypothetical protein
MLEDQTKKFLLSNGSLKNKWLPDKSGFMSYSQRQTVAKEVRRCILIDNIVEQRDEV